MPKVIFFLLFPLFLTGFLTHPKVIQADTLNMALSPSSVNYTANVRVSVSNIPKKADSYNLTVTNSSSSNIQIITRDDGSCQMQGSGIGAWVSPSCSGSGPITFSGDLQTSNIGISPPVTDTSYTVRFESATLSTSGDFIIKASSLAPTTSLSIQLFAPQNPTEKDTLNITYQGITPNNCLVIYFNPLYTNNYKFQGSIATPRCYDDSETYISYTVTNSKGSFPIDPSRAGDYELYIRDYEQSCTLGLNCQWKVKRTSNKLTFKIQPAPSSYKATLTIQPPSGKAGDKFTALVSLQDLGGTPVSRAPVIIEALAPTARLIGNGSTDNSGSADIDISKGAESLAAGNYAIQARITAPLEQLTIFPSDLLRITQDKKGNKIPGIQSCTGKSCTTSSGGIPCDPKTGGAGSGGIMTAIGCIPTKPEALIQGLFRVALGAGGAVGLLLLIGGSFQMITSAGNPEGVKNGSEMMTSAVVGILIVIFSVFLLQVIGVDILQLPGFGK